MDDHWKDIFEGFYLSAIYAIYARRYCCMKWAQVGEIQSNSSILPFILTSMITLSKIVGISNTFWLLETHFSRFSILLNLSLLAQLPRKLLQYEVGSDGWISIKFFDFAFYSFFHDHLVKSSWNIRNCWKDIFWSFPSCTITSEVIAVWSGLLWWNFSQKCSTNLT